VSPWHRELDIKLNGARAVNLLPGETLEFPKPQNNGVNFEAFQDAAVRKIAAAVGTSAEQLSRDFRQMTFASAKLSLGDVWRHFVVNRELCIRQVGLPFVSAWLEEAIDSQRLPLPNGKTGGIADYMAVRAAIFAKSTFVSWGPPMVEPVKEREGQKLALGLGLTTLQTEAQNDGLDWEEIAIQRNRERKLQEKLDLPLPEELEKSAAPPGEEDGPPGAPAKKKPA
jgi:capsid protein